MRRARDVEEALDAGEEGAEGAAELGVLGRELGRERVDAGLELLDEEVGAGGRAEGGGGGVEAEAGEEVGQERVGVGVGGGEGSELGSRDGRGWGDVVDGRWGRRAVQVGRAVGGGERRIEVFV